MALSNAERQRRHTLKVKGSVLRIDLEVPFEIGVKLGYLAHHWHSTKREALCRLLVEAWEREGCPVPGYDS